MTELMQLNLAEGGQVLVEIDENEPGVLRASRVGDVVESSMESLEAALEPVRRLSHAALRALRAGPSAPDEVEVEFGVRFTAQAGAVIAKTGVEGHLQVTLRWSHGTPEA